ncbi:MAG: ribonuclease HII [Deltaproteobacteria bacterium]|nr:ribonuclease HII [Deltaproteobacteria bacterium]
MKESQMWLSGEMGGTVQPGEIEEEGYSAGFKCIAGLDEVGRGPLAGPVVAAAVILPREFLVSSSGLRVDSRVKTPDPELEIKDSKLLTFKEREALAPWIKEKALAWGLGMVASKEIDRMNILKASLLAMAHAFRQLQPAPDYLLIDGPYEIPLTFFKAGGGRKIPSTPCLAAHIFPHQRAIKKGDRLCLSIAAASIVAKVARDQMMIEYDKLYPKYGFAQHKGYGSPLHLAALRRYGPSPIHRRSFRPVRELLAPACDVGPVPLFPEE